MSRVSTLYDILEVQPSASVDEIRRAYKQKALETHPDKLVQGATEQEKLDAEANFRKVQEACEVLSDSQRRLAYDVRMRIKTTDRRAMSDEQIARLKDRENWARKQEEEHQIRMAEIREQRRRLREQSLYHLYQTKLEASIGQRLLDEYCDIELHPEWEARKRALQERQRAVRTP